MNSKEISSEEFFHDNMFPFFDTPTTQKPSFDEAVEQFFGEREDDKFFKKEEDMFEIMRENEEFFFKEKSKPVKLAVNDSVTVSQRSKLCNCHDVYCGCCYSVKLFGREKFKGCMEMEYVSRDFAIFMTFSINGHIIITRVLSGRNPLPFCSSTPYIPLVSFCIRLYDIHHNPNGLSLCMRLEATSMRRILFSISFDCIKIDNHRISFYMPPNATTFGVVGFHLGDTDPYISYQDWTKLHIPLPEITPAPPPPKPTYKHHLLWLHW
ncbi:uncharacterized protein LOC129001234 isoform X2 [Macrosteles quadrilineatus]|uniref:uncharacterized protein LOC129001234 isoform X2 n=1 Tax=Macrosteles quadrilineatus TaxID=74068 RepID=UPI0023E0C87A|nr:uncharacterized protein LOC129001234 isoform X2 [Macrosteles quadrilineatus]